MPESRYRSQHDRARSVYRRANPWYRRLARAIVGVTLVAGAVVAVTFGAIELRDRFDRDRLPASGTSEAGIRSSSFEIRSTAPTLDGTLTLDTETGAFLEFVGRTFGAQAGVRVASADGSTALISLSPESAWVPAGEQQVVADLFRARTYLIDNDHADAILTDVVRDRYLVLDQRTEIGSGGDRIVRYDVLIDTEAFGAEDPVAFADFRDRAIPGAPEAPALPVTLTVDEQRVLTGVESDVGEWTWQRLAYSGDPFVPDLADPVADPAISIADGNLGD